MSKHEDFKTILDEITDLKLLNLLWKNIDDTEAEKQSLRLIRVFRQYIERLRRIVDDGNPHEDKEDARIYRLVDVWKLPKDVLVKVMWEFLQWHKSEDGECPSMTCKDYPCQFKKERKATLAENLANGDLDQETYDKYMAAIADDMYECGYGEGCWASYYAWCYLNGYNPMNGKKEK